MMTEKLFYDDAYLKAFSAVVTESVPGKKGWEICLDRTAFYPEGGGQPGDTGFLSGVRVMDTHERDGKIIHYCSDKLEAGSRVEGSVDFDRRFDLMQQHSGEHIVSGIIHEIFGCDNVGFHMGRDVVTIDFNCAIAAERLEEIERKANRIIWENRPFKISWPDKKALEDIRYRSKKELSGAVRIVECEGADICACCGLHVKSSGEIGVIKLLNVHPFREGVRMEMLSGERAYEYLRRAAEQNSAIGALLSARTEATCEAVERLLHEAEAAAYRITGLENRIFEEIAKKYAGKDRAAVFEPKLSPDGVRRLADMLLSRCAGLAAVFSGEGETYKYALGARNVDVRAMGAEMNSRLNGRGGGKPKFVQGSLNCSRGEIEKFLMENGFDFQ